MFDRLCVSLCIVMNIPLVALARDELQQIRQDFSADPHWEGFNNRVVADGGPTIKQSFGLEILGRLRPYRRHDLAFAHARLVRDGNRPVHFRR